MGFVERVADPATGSVDNQRTAAAIALEPALDALARSVQCHIEAEAALCTVTVSNLMWQLRKQFEAEALPPRRVVMQFRFSDPGLHDDTYWALIQPGAPVEVCVSIPGFEIDLFVETNRTSLAGIMLARTSIAAELANGGLYLSGDPVLSRTMHRWLRIGPDYTDFDNIACLPPERGAQNASPRIARRA